MAKLTLLQCMNTILKRLGEPTIANTGSSMSTTNQMVFDNLNRVLQELATDTNLKQLEASGSITLALSTLTYDPPADFHVLAYDSIQTPSTSEGVLAHLTPDEFDQFYPTYKLALTQGMPTAITYYVKKLKINSTPIAADVGKTVTFRYFQTPTIFTAGSDTGTCFLPEPFDNTLLCDYATYLTMEYMSHPKAEYYRMLVFGDAVNRHPEGSLSKYKRAWSAPIMKPRFTYGFSHSRS